MVSRYDVTFCTIASNAYQKKCINELSREFPNLKIEFLDKSEKPSNQKKINRIRLKIKKKIFSFFTEDTKEAINNQLGINIIDKQFTDFLNQVLTKSKYDIIQLEFFESLSLLGMLPKQMKKVFVHHEIRFKRNFFSSQKYLYDQYINQVLKTTEIALLGLADTIIVFNDGDKNVLSDLNKPIVVSPFGMTEELIIKDNESVTFNKLLFIGSETHFPNKEGLTWFLDHIYLPNYSEINFPISITGYWSDDFKLKYSLHNQINFVGFIPSFEEVFENSILVTPIKSGSGLRTKILQAFANKIPVISTKFASEGLYEQSKEMNHILHFENKFDFLNVIKKVKENPEHLINIAVLGNKYLNEFYNTNDLIKKRFNVYDSI